MTESDRFNAIRNKIDAVLAKAHQAYGVDLHPTVDFNLRGKTAGIAGMKHTSQGRIYTLRFNRDLILGDHFEDILNNTVAHEIAHLVCFSNPKLGKNHDRGWWRVCIVLGGDGKTCHNYKIEYARGSYDYITSAGHHVTISAQRHALIMKGKTYVYKSGKGRIDRFCRFCRTGETMPDAPHYRMDSIRLIIPDEWSLRSAPRAA